MCKLLALPPRFVAVVLISGSVALGAGIPARLVSADANNTQNVQQTEVQLPGTPTATTGGTANSGAAIALANAIVHQINVQVAAGNQQAIANSSQTATNNADVTQTSAASTGDTTGSNGGMASSGTATAATTAIILQLNIQIMALLSPDCVVNQVASNDAGVGQTAIAASGEATADGMGSTAASGRASAWNRALIIQRNIQVYVCTGHGDATEAGSQQAVNDFAQEQVAIALTGAAGASGDSTGGSGSAAARLRDSIRQTNRQIVVN
jgi:hypothetical protein